MVKLLKVYFSSYNTPQYVNPLTTHNLAESSLYVCLYNALFNVYSFDRCKHMKIGIISFPASISLVPISVPGTWKLLSIWLRREGREGRRCRSREGRKKGRNRAGRGGSEDKAKRDTHIFRELCESPYQMSGTGTTPGQLTEMGRKSIILREDQESSSIHTGL